MTGAFGESDWTADSDSKTSHTYDTIRRPVLTTLPDGETTENSYDGWSETMIDQNDHVKRWDNDGLGRMTKATEYTGDDPDHTVYAETSYEYEITDELTKVTDAASNVTTITYDELGRKAAMADPDMGSWSYSYNAVGGLSNQTDAAGQSIEFAYDKLNRPTSKWYPPAWTEDTITAGVSRPTVHDLYELRAAIDTNLAAAGLSTASWTDPEIVAGTGVNIRAVHFTELRDRIQDLWTAASLGDVPQFTAGAIEAGSRNIKVSDLTDLRSWLYDSDSDNTSYETSTWAETRRARAFYEYDSTDDSAGAGKGRRTGMWDGSGSSSWKYDKYGRGGVDRRVVDGKTYETEYTYDALHRARKMTYPDDEALTYSYEASLFLDGVQSSIDSLNLVSSVSYKDIGLPDSYTLGSSPTTATQSFEYWKIDDTARSPYGALKRTKLTKDSTDLVNREMQYDAVGNVTKIVDGVNSETIDYTYDELDRLLTASAPSGESFVYNTIGNMTSKSGTTLDYGTTSPKHGVKTYGSASYTYDANGSMTAKGDLSIKYDPEHRPVRVQDSGTIYRVVYDGDGVRRKRLDENGTIHYLGDYERNVGNGSDTTEVVTKYYYATLGAMTRLIAFRRAGTLHWVGSDHLGGTIRVMDSSFAAVDGMRYEPYGEDRDAGDALLTDRKFTGQTQDQSIGLYWYASRAYDPDTGRFCTPDPIVPAPGYPPALNRYSYVYNNPLKFIDPSGHSPEWFNEAWKAEFRAAHDGVEPEDEDFVYRYMTMAAATGLLQQTLGDFANDVGHGEWPHSNLPDKSQFDLGANIRRAAELGEGRSILSTIEFIGLLVPGGEWDYKARIGPKFENFGNFHFGIVVAAFLDVRSPIPSASPPYTYSLVPQEKRDTNSLSAAGLAHILFTGSGEGIPFTKEPYGDDPKDQAWIKLGMHFYHSLSISVVRRAAKL